MSEFFVILFVDVLMFFWACVEVYKLVNRLKPSKEPKYINSFIVYNPNTYEAIAISGRKWNAISQTWVYKLNDHNSIPEYVIDNLKNSGWK